MSRSTFKKSPNGAVAHQGGVPSSSRRSRGKPERKRSPKTASRVGAWGKVNGTKRAREGHTCFQALNSREGQLMASGASRVGHSYGYGSETIPLYQSHPGVLAILPNGGVLADATQCCEIDFKKESIVQFIVSASYPVITFGPFASHTTILKSLSHAIGEVRKLQERANCRPTNKGVCEQNLESAIEWGSMGLVVALAL
ncbi:hypothetical protein GH714_040206 [Hevea brasiliensis]|uniref:Uncharacterized protein n=1 Tax=Hevea brasiliensis TaxID=3981 RepID=A0A6A6MTE0_HEVBR|nr:hypothetical protein GH714_040206 [Hevea brasiliensis]